MGDNRRSKLLVIPAILAALSVGFAAPASANFTSLTPAPPTASSLAASVETPTPSNGARLSWSRTPPGPRPYFGARYYASKIGRFTTVDPLYTWQENLLDPQRWNRYAYGRNNPFRYVDPDGRDPVTVALIVITATAFVLNNPTNTNVTQGPVNDTIVPNSVIVAGGYGLAAGGARMAAKEVLQETVENVTGLPVGGLPDPRGASKTATEMADTLSGRIGKNSVPFETPSTRGHIDLKGKAHFDKSSGQEIPTPHVQTRPKHVGPQGQVNLGPQTTRPATKADIRTAEKLVDRKQQ